MEKTGRGSASEEEGAVALPPSVLSRLRHHQSHHRRLWNREERRRRSHADRRCPVVALPPTKPVLPLPRRSCRRVLSCRHCRCPGAHPPSSLRGHQRENERGSGSSPGRGAMLHTTVATTSPALKLASTTIKPEGKRHCYCPTVASSAFPILFLKLRSEAATVVPATMAVVNWEKEEDRCV
ncbi:uncharacterized protein DS421_16g544480 [Arachis hypogaea]|nr:uncharacterized protein DS421_16g544480 [Arachis hypogaea]